jgi:hypothetical protein
MLELDLSRHCVETAIRHRYNAAIQTYFKEKSERRHIEKDIAVLLEALETLDFSALRGKHPALAGSTPARITLASDPKGKLTLLIDGRPLRGLPQRKTPRQS